MLKDEKKNLKKEKKTTEARVKFVNPSNLLKPQSVIF